MLSCASFKTFLTSASVSCAVALTATSRPLLEISFWKAEIISSTSSRHSRLLSIKISIKFVRHVAQEFRSRLCKFAKLKFFHNKSPLNNRNARDLLSNFKIRRADFIFSKSGKCLFGLFALVKIITFNFDWTT